MKGHPCRTLPSWLLRSSENCVLLEGVDYLLKNKTSYTDLVFRKQVARDIASFRDK